MKKGKLHSSEKCEDAECEICKYKKPFDMPKAIIDSYKKGDLVIFAGAGISTESHSVFGKSFYQEIREELNITDGKKISFCKLMSLYTQQPHSRKDLLLAVKKRIDYVKSFPELYQSATQFHQELSTIPHLDDIFTTNWDDFFEQECAATPIVTDEDFGVLFDVPGRKVYKLHGSIYNYGSIVATEKDYRKCYRRLSIDIIGAQLKLLLMSKTVVFLGFSFEDEDFQKIYHLLNKDIAGLMPTSYLVTIDEQAKSKLQKLHINATPIVTSGSFFVQRLKEELVKEKSMLPDSQYNGLEEIYDELMKAHRKVCDLKTKEHPDALYTQWYQDGLKHAFERLIATKKSGENSCAYHMAKTIESYDNLIKERLSYRHYPDVAYFTGYQAGLVFFLSDKEGRESLPLYYLFGCGDILTFEEFLEAEKEAPKLHKSAHKLVVALSARMKDNLVLHRRPL
jgi:NAD-dependent SIR2 family protein deacetylase